ncbi:hypothetical protein RJ641_004285 [Dillenia turbinata]|uniref:Lipoamide acyltransferase component of branched-chain alpha-keto acid dehydrogenase complex, mitochondrial n=1 Tax=Dillenia turbinata TaxID=194707 RepID=A0AAN8VI32_9MAGN
MMIGRRFSQKKEWVWGGRRLFSFVVAAGGQDTPSASSSGVSPFLGSRSSSSVLYPPTSSPPFHGDHVEEFQPLCEVQSDKATIEITSRYKGKVSEILYVPGDIVKVGETLLRMSVDSAFPLDSSPNTNLPGSDSKICDINTQASAHQKARMGGVLSTPAIRNLAKECGININDVCGTGKDGRVLKEDVFSYAAQKGIKMADHLIDEFLGRRETKSSTSTSDGQYAQPFGFSIGYQMLSRILKEARKLSFLDDEIYGFNSAVRGFQRAMVKSMMMAAKVPHFHYIEEINCEAMVDLKSSFQSQNCDPDIKHTFLPILTKTLSMALSKYPMMNSCYIEETQEVILRGSHNIGIAMATPHGLVVPNIKNVQTLSLLEVTRELSRLQHLALENKLTPEDISGGTITLSNIGAIGGKFGSPLLNLPEVAIIAMGRIQRVPRYLDDENVYPASIMTVNIGADHRVLDGSTVARFCNEWKQLIENPEIVGFDMMTLVHVAWLLVGGENLEKPSFAFSWPDDKNAFKAGDIAFINIKVLGNFHGHALNLVLSVNDKVGNSSLVSGVASYFEGDPHGWRISFIPIMVGVFNVLITDDHFGVFDSSLHYQVLPGALHSSVCEASWLSLANEFVAGEEATVLILPKDAFGNNISLASDEPHSCNFSVSSTYVNGSDATVINSTFMGWNEFGYVSIKFTVASAGSLLLRVGGGNQILKGSPLHFKVNPGSMDVSSCLAEWKYGTNLLQIFSKLEIFIHQRDFYGNLVPALYAFDAQVINKGTNLSVPVADLSFKEVTPGIQLFSFKVSEPGSFVLTIFDIERKKSILNMPYEYTVFLGYCDGSNSIVNGSGLDISIAGETAKFSVYLYDKYQYPSLIEKEMLWIHIVREVDSYRVLPTVYLKEISNDNELAPHPNNTSAGVPKVEDSAFNVLYTPVKSGTYKINVFCGNVQLNSGHSFKKEVRPGAINMSLSRVVKFSDKIPQMVKSEIVVQLMDSYSNPVLFQNSKLALEIGSNKSSGYVTWEFTDNNNGTYTVYYLMKDVGTYEICAAFDGNHFSPCPIQVNVYKREYFPIANDDLVSVWEDESVAFDVLQNDHFADGNSSTIEFSQPAHGSVLQYGSLLRYTPYKNFFGNDSFLYTISDVNGNQVSAAVNLSVLTIPPQLVAFPSQLQATEDLISPRFGGFSGFEIVYSAVMENITVSLGAKSGSIFLSPMLMMFGQRTLRGLSVIEGDGEPKTLTLMGHVDIINYALQSIQYLGNANFSGEDKLLISTMNKNGKSNFTIPVLVEPINDPPFIDVPEFIILDENNGRPSPIFDQEKHSFKFSADDPDFVNFPGNDSQFVVAFSMEVNSGVLVTNLPAELINTTELKLKNSGRWQPVQTFVTISKRFAVRAKGVRFRATLAQCNNIMKKLLYEGEEHGASLTLIINDMGNYGCYPDCTQGMSVPLSSESTINLIRRMPMTSFVAHALGSAIVIEFLVTFSLGVLLVFYMCKCAFVLLKEKRSPDARTSEPSKLPNSLKQASGINLTEDVTYLSGCCPSPLSFGEQSSNFRQRSRKQSKQGESSSEAYHSSQLVIDQTQQASLPNFTPLSIEKEKKEAI